MLSLKHDFNVYDVVCANRERGAARVRIDRLIKPNGSIHVLQLSISDYSILIYCTRETRANG